VPAKDQTKVTVSSVEPGSPAEGKRPRANKVAVLRVADGRKPTGLPVPDGLRRTAKPRTCSCAPAKFQAGDVLVAVGGVKLAPPDRRVAIGITLTRSRFAPLSSCISSDPNAFAQSG